jgi:hypothetical protein
MAANERLISENAKPDRFSAIELVVVAVAVVVAVFVLAFLWKALNL